jgi:hypothetical protein
MQDVIAKNLDAYVDDRRRRRRSMAANSRLPHIRRKNGADGQRGRPSGNERTFKLYQIHTDRYKDRVCRMDNDRPKLSEDPNRRQ